jgi:hypothetical protein
MPLTPIEEITGLAEGIKESLSDDGFYTQDTECKLLDKYSC